MHAILPLDHQAVAARLRHLTPAIHRQVDNRTRLFLDAPSGTQMPAPVVKAMVDYLEHGTANRGGVFSTSLETEATLVRARELVAALLGTSSHDVIFGQNMTSLSFAVAASVARDWPGSAEGSRVVVSEIDHHANIDPWRSVAADHGMEVGWLRVDPDRVALDLSDLDRLVDGNCRVVSVGLSSNAVGTIADIARITARAREVGAISVIDAVHGLSHIPIDVDAWGADIVLFSAYKVFGPHIGAMAIRGDLLDRINYYKLAPASNRGPSKAEHGTQNMEALAGFCASVDLIASLGGTSAVLRQRLTAAIGAFARHEDDLTATFVDGLNSLLKVRIARAPDGVPKTSTIAFTVDGLRPADVAAACARDGVYITNGDFYATTLAQRTGVAANGGWLRVGLAAYHDQSDVVRALASIEKAIRTQAGHRENRK